MKEKELVKLRKKVYQLLKVNDATNRVSWWNLSDDVVDLIEGERERVIGKQADDMRKGQTVFNFLVWLKEEKGVDGKNKMADPFYITDDNWDKLFKEYTKIINKLKK